MLSLCHAVGKNNILAQLDIKLESGLGRIIMLISRD